MARRKPTHPADVSRVDFLRQQLQEIEQNLLDMDESKSWQALVAGRRLALNIRTELDEAKAAAPKEFEPQTLGDVVAEVLKLPKAVWRHPDVVARVKACS